ncbi:MULTISPECIES: polysaccharide biosynthesis/export family protein [Sphingomonas]|uniref:polysaccharide biosynthesis/export family protein n=1 Tax=Sphingomonas TaxID=13687 RepID=UPI000DEEB06D|nr:MULTISPECIES: polysaccharide biosynthesis/export family protein [Sphingomonas]
MAKAYATLGLAVGLAAALGSCADKRGGPIAYNVALAAPDAPKIVPLEQDYRIAPLDVLTVKVFKQPDLSGDYPVDLTGNISMPLIGNVQVAELTTSELDGRLKAQYGAKYLEKPDISVGVKSSTRRSVTVDGAVKNSGSFPVAGPVSLIQAIAQAGGTTEDANPRRVAIFRSIAGKRQAAAFDLTDIRRGLAQDPTIYPGDIVVVDGSRVKATQKAILSNIPLLSIFRPF